MVSRMNSRLIALTLSFVISLFASVATAGDCPVCSTSADCTRDGGNPGFCVRWDTSPGCGTTVQICCPGQGCNLAANGRPSCEAAGRCVVIGEATDGGTADASTATDASTTTDVATTADTGTTSGSDAGTASDGATSMDAPGGDAAGTGTRPSGCGCSVTGREHTGAVRGMSAMLAMIGVAFARRRR
jgi:MYXO-CTERM domain-containing protein